MEEKVGMICNNPNYMQSEQESNILEQETNAFDFDLGITSPEF